MLKIIVSGKCIIAGEHAVLRGVPAFAVPVTSKTLELVYLPHAKGSSEGITTEFGGTHGADLRMLFSGVMDRALTMTHHTHADAAGHFQISSEVPVGAGLGASATLCVAVGRFCAYKGWVKDADLQEFCRSLEDLFHGESSGLDIAVALSQKGLHFIRGGARREVNFAWAPNWCISYSGKRGITAECIAKVKALLVSNPTFAQQIDERMRLAVERSEKALQATSEGQLAELADALNEACSCFVDWGLAGGDMGRHLEMLRSQGAIAVKPTGSGNGGFALSLWRSRPPEGLGLISI